MKAQRKRSFCISIIMQSVKEIPGLQSLVLSLGLSLKGVVTDLYCICTCPSALAWVWMASADQCHQYLALIALNYSFVSLLSVDTHLSLIFCHSEKMLLEAFLLRSIRSHQGTGCCEINAGSSQHLRVIIQCQGRDAWCHRSNDTGMNRNGLGAGGLTPASTFQMGKCSHSHQEYKSLFLASCTQKILSAMCHCQP